VGLRSPLSFSIRIKFSSLKDSYSKSILELISRSIPVHANEFWTSIKTMVRRYAITINRSTSQASCAVCDKPIEPNIGPELFLRDDWKIVCHACGLEECPLLTALLSLANASTTYAAAILESDEILTSDA